MGACSSEHSTQVHTAGFTEDGHSLIEPLSPMPVEKIFPRPGSEEMERFIAQYSFDNLYNPPNQDFPQRPRSRTHSDKISLLRRFKELNIGRINMESESSESSTHTKFEENSVISTRDHLPGDQLFNNDIGAQIEDEVKDQLEDEVKIQAEERVKDKVEQQMEEQVEENTDVEIEEPLTKCEKVSVMPTQESLDNYLLSNLSDPGLTLANPNVAESFDIGMETFNKKDSES